MRSLAQRIALQFSFALALLVFLLASFFISVVGTNVRDMKDKEIEHALESIINAMQEELSIYSVEVELPYYITYTVYDARTREVTATNAPFIPILPVTDKKPVSYFEKDFYTDGDLNVVYETQQIQKDNATYVIQISNSVDRDTMSNLFKFISPKAMIMGFLPLLLISYLTSFFIAKRTLKPIVKMTKSAASISSSNLDTLLYVGSKHDELDSLAKTFNELFARLKQDFIAVKAANSAKTNFLSNMSHEIRTPINAVLGLDEMILRESTESNIQTYAHDIQSSGRSLLAIINDILDFSKIEAGKMEIIPVDYDLCTTIADLSNMITTRAESKGLKFIINIDETMPHKLHGDETRIKQCILNILTNAVKYTPSGSVTMNISYDKSLDPTEKNIIYLRAQVIDTGIGIKPEDIKKLFSPFERIEERRNRTIEGTGLGMSIVKSLLSSMGSHLEVKSEYGKGSDFSFSLEQEVLDWEKIGNWEEMKEKLEAEKAAYKESFQAPEAKILVVDDTSLNLTVIKGLLRSTRIQIDTCESGFDALKMCRTKKYDLLLIDHRMPKMDGIEMLHVLRREDTNPNKDSPCISLTANALSGARELYLSVGFQDYLSKPVEASKLEAMLMKYLPETLILRSGDEGFIEQDKNSWNGIERRKNGSHEKEAHCAVELLHELFGIDFCSALHNCGTSEVFMEALRNFYDAIQEKSDLIEKYQLEENWKDYTILVHALKSTARLIGAQTLSENAAHLEMCGDKAENNEAPSIIEIKEKTPELLTLYRSYIPKLARILGEASENKAELPLIEKEKLEDAYSALKEVVSVFDFDSADAIIEELSKYSVPPDCAEKFKKLKKAVQSVDQTGILQLLA